MEERKVNFADPRRLLCARHVFALIPAYLCGELFK